MLRRPIVMASRALTTFILTPPARTGMQTLDRAAFDLALPIRALKFNASLTSKLRTLFSGWILDVPRFVGEHDALP